MCSGRVDLAFVLRAFLNGSDGVFIGGCRLNECNYLTHGNYHALNMVCLCKKIMEHMGLNPDRLRVEFMSSGDGIRFAGIMNDFGRQVKQIGPIGKAEGMDKDELNSRLKAVIRLIPYIKMKKREKLELRFDNLEDYNNLYTLDEIKSLFSEVVSYYIDPERCQACMICARKCPVEAISGGKNKIHVIDQEKCIKCGTCLKACPPRFGAVSEIAEESVPPPVSEEKRIIIRKSKKHKI